MFLSISCYCEWQDVLWFGCNGKIILSLSLSLSQIDVLFVHCEVKLIVHSESDLETILMSELSISVKCGLHHNQMVEPLKREDNTTSFPILSLFLSSSLTLSAAPCPCFSARWPYVQFLCGIQTSPISSPVILPKLRHLSENECEPERCSHAEPPLSWCCTGASPEAFWSLHSKLQLIVFI